MDVNTLKKKDALGKQDDLIDLTNSPVCLPRWAHSTPASLPKRTLIDQTILESPQLITLPRKYTMSELDRSDQEGLLSMSDYERLSSIALCDDSLPSNLSIVPTSTMASAAFKKPTQPDRNGKSVGIPRTLAKYQALPKFPKLETQPVLLPDEITRTIEVFNRRFGKSTHQVESLHKHKHPYWSRQNGFNVAANEVSAKKPAFLPKFTPIGVKMKILKARRVGPFTSTPMEYACKSKAPSKAAALYRENKASLLRKKANKVKVKTCWRRK
ncbi:hypothetical protein M514_10839 [Trichuris suis]|uniref:Uncharacterized protein n=1 Tax=Trichuris suis TaxID=68888 RepID=A0A085LTG6_9BILA|nr:hypothetical protein M513_10839 [Trichuris suis]KFD63282.1 hypothetical protein M514_10839 [Trichuris suis]